MARNAQIRSQARYSGSRQYAGETRSGEGKVREEKVGLGYTDGNGNLKLSTKQLLIFWSGTLLTMLAAFYLGFVAGKREGAIAVLDRAGEEMVKLELHTPVEPYPKASELGEGEINAETEGLGQNLLNSKDLGKDTLKGQNDVQKTTGDVTNEREPVKIDFTGSNSLPSSEPKVDAEALKKLEEFKKKVKADQETKFQDISKNNNLVPNNTAAVLPGSTTSAAKVQNLEELAPKKGWYVQVAATTTESDALSFVGKVASKNLTGNVEPASVKNRSFFRVLVGPFASQQEALQNRANLKQTLGIAGEPFIRQVQ